MKKSRLRDFGVSIGTLPTGIHNAITDVPDVLVGHTTLIHDRPRLARTGVTVVLPRANRIRDDHVFAGYHSFNGNGEMTGLLWLGESGMLGSPVALTNTNQVGIVREALIEYDVAVHEGKGFRLPVVAETWDGWLNDMDAFHVKKSHVFTAIESANSGPVKEGNVGGGTGMVCHGFKGGIGSASRLILFNKKQFTLGVLVQTNYGERADLRVDGFPVGREICPEQYPLPEIEVPGGSIIVIIATDAPFLPTQCKRLAQRATVGLARVGGFGHNFSGDIFLAFSNGNHVPAQGNEIVGMQMIPNHAMDSFFNAVAEATEEAILNALCAAETMIGFQDRTVYALPGDEMQRILKTYHRL